MKTYINMLEKMLIEYCSPTLCGIKTAGLFRFPCTDDKALNDTLAFWNRELNPKGILLCVLNQDKERPLIYVCRTSMLAWDLGNEDVQLFLSGYGYQKITVEYCIETLKDKLTHSTEFPHEIGVFLGYPLEDVKGFIKNGGQNSKCNGCWKVYCNECEAKKLFLKYKKCKEIYRKLFENRVKSVFQLTVVA